MCFENYCKNDIHVVFTCRRTKLKSICLHTLYVSVSTLGFTIFLCFSSLSNSISLSIFLACSFLSIKDSTLHSFSAYSILICHIININNIIIYQTPLSSIFILLSHLFSSIHHFQFLPFIFLFISPSFYRPNPFIKLHKIGNKKSNLLSLFREEKLEIIYKFRFFIQ